jgi:hypothetical protein
MQSVPSQEAISPRKIPPVLSVAKSTKPDSRPHSTASRYVTFTSDPRDFSLIINSNLACRSMKKIKSSGKQAQAVSALSERGYMKLAARRWQNFNRCSNKRKINPEDDEPGGVRAIRIFNPAFNAGLLHDNYEKARRGQTSDKPNHSKGPLVRSLLSKVLLVNSSIEFSRKAWI